MLKGREVQGGGKEKPRTLSATTTTAITTTITTVFEREEANIKLPV